MVAAEDDVATIMTVESGKPLKESKGEFTSGCAARLGGPPAALGACNSGIAQAFLCDCLSCTITSELSMHSTPCQAA